MAEAQFQLRFRVTYSSDGGVDTGRSAGLMSGERLLGLSALQDLLTQRGRVISFCPTDDYACFVVACFVRGRLRKDHWLPARLFPSTFSVTLCR